VNAKNEDSLMELTGSAVQLVAEPDHLVGSTIANRFVIEAHLGDFEGRQIYAGKQPALERPVTIKLVKEATDLDLCKRFIREGRVLAKLDHPGIVSVIDVGEFDGRPYVVTEAPKGDTLEAILEVRGRIDWRAAHDLLIALSDAVGCAHNAGLVHRDLHPRNVVIGPDGLPRITDFVFAYESAPYADDAKTQLLTTRGAVVGAIEWVAPEQLMGFPVDTRADIYSLGVLAYRMVAGHTPYRGAHAAEIIALQASSATPLMEAAKLPESARPFAQLVDRLLSNEPDGRGFKNASELAKALRTQRAISMSEAEDSVTEPALPSDTKPIKERAIAVTRFVVAQSKPLVAKAKEKTKPLVGMALAMPRGLRVLVAASAVVLAAGLVAMASGDGAPEIEAQPMMAQPLAPPIDPSQVALLDDARRAFASNDVPRALHAYRSLAQGAFEAEDYQNVVVYLGRPNSNTGVAEQILLATAPSSVPAVREAFDSDRSSRYLKRRAGEVLEKLGEDVDLVPLWIGTLQSRRIPEEIPALLLHDGGIVLDPDAAELAFQAGYADHPAVSMRSSSSS
jgi:serine/threonine-protein kinase